MIDKAAVRLVGSDERRRARQPPVHMRRPAPKIGNILRQMIVPNRIRDEVHIHASADFTGRQFSSVKAVNFGPFGYRERALLQQDIGIAPDKTFAGTVLPRMPKNVGKLRHFGTSREERRFQSQSLNAVEQPFLGDAKAFVWTRIDPLERDPQFRCGIEQEIGFSPPSGDLAACLEAARVKTAVGGARNDQPEHRIRVQIHGAW